MMVLEYGSDIIAVDCGVMFPKEEMLGVDLVIPNITYLLERKENFRGIVITHGHEDHIGALPYILNQINVPVYASRLTQGLINVKLREARLIKEARINLLEPGQVIEMGAFSIEFFRVCHSIPDAMGVVIRTPVGNAVHTGDFKFDHTPIDGKRSDMARLADIGNEGVLLLMSDSTYAEIPGYTPSEQVVSETMNRVVGQAKGRVIVATFASLISRVQQVVDAAVLHGRRVVVVGRSMQNNVQMAIRLGYLNIPEGTLAKPGDLGTLPPEQVVIVTTGSQGEPTSALVRMANHDHREVTIQRGDTVIMSATPIPGNEVLVYKTIDNLYREGAKVLHDKVEKVHVHGHAAQEELKTMLSLIRPKYFVPLHGEYRHLVLHAGIAQAMGVPAENTFVLEDGNTLEIDRDGARRGPDVTAGPIYVDGLARWEMESVVLRDRKMLARDGIVVVFLAIDHETSEVIGSPEVVSYGFLDEHEKAGLMETSERLILEALAHGKGQRADLGFVHSKVKDALSKYYYEATKRRPMILPVALEV